MEPEHKGAMNERTFHADRAHVLDDPNRPTWLSADHVIAKIRLKENSVVADIGAGTGYFAIPFAEMVGSRGKVVAVDFQSAMLGKIKAKLDAYQRLTNVELVSGSATSTTLQAKSVDMVFMANLWHELDELPSVLSEAARVLRQDGRLAIVDWRADMASPPGPPAAHRVALASVIQTLESNGWKILDSGFVGVYSHFVLAETSTNRT